ncbi:MAG TPA: hypothetical protein VHK63_01580 [Candidatus Limnocylindria bacterium]|nr:hypothetical protein [Candidatus Limnocylindria bacterium]
MPRRARYAAALLSLGLLLAAIPAATGARVDDWARVVRSRHAGATFVHVTGCEQLEVYVSAMDGKFVNRHAAVNKQGLVGVLVVARDACAAIGPKGYPVTYSADGMSFDSLRSSARFDSAAVTATLPGTDSNGDAVEIAVEIAWQPTAAFERSRVSGQGWFPPEEKHGARVNTFSHTGMAPAVAWGSVAVDGRVLELAPTLDASLEQVRYACKVIQHPNGGFDVDC